MALYGVFRVGSSRYSLPMRIYCQVILHLRNKELDHAFAAIKAEVGNSPGHAEDIQRQILRIVLAYGAKDGP